MGDFKMYQFITIFSVLLGLTCAIGWLTHVIWWVNLLIDNELDTIGEAVLAILGTLALPIGVIHGIVLWF